jgi:hypothetical protein
MLALVLKGYSTTSTPLTTLRAKTVNCMLTGHNIFFSLSEWYRAMGWRKPFIHFCLVSVLPVALLR